MNTNEKWWVISYSIKWRSGRIDEVQSKIKALNISLAIEKARENIFNFWIDIPEVVHVAIWDVGLLMGEPVF